MWRRIDRKCREGCERDRDGEIASAITRTKVRQMQADKMSCFCQRCAAAGVERPLKQHSDTKSLGWKPNRIGFRLAASVRYANAIRYFQGVRTHSRRHLCSVLMKDFVL